MALLVPLALILTLLLATDVNSASEACSSYSIGLDTTYTTTRDGPYGGRADGQVFLARDTLITSISVWRAAPDTNHFGMKLFLTSADSTGRPNLTNLLLSGPTIVVPSGDGAEATEYKWAFDPPFALPSRGYFWFGVQPDPCQGFFDLLFNNQNAHEDGDNWRTVRILPGEPCVLVRNATHYPEFDLIFTIVFCDVTTPVLPTTWGALKVRYR